MQSGRPEGYTIRYARRCRWRRRWGRMSRGGSGDHHRRRGRRPRAARCPAGSCRRAPPAPPSPPSIDRSGPPGGCVGVARGGWSGRTGGGPANHQLGLPRGQRERRRIWDRRCGPTTNAAAKGGGYSRGCGFQMVPIDRSIGCFLHWFSCEDRRGSRTRSNSTSGGWVTLGRLHSAHAAPRARLSRPINHNRSACIAFQIKKAVMELVLCLVHAQTLHVHVLYIVTLSIY